MRDGGAIINFSSSRDPAAPGPATPRTPRPRARSRRSRLILARELRGRDITVNAVAPGPTATALFLDGKPQELIDRIAAEPPLERLGQPEDIAEVVAFLAGPAAGSTARSSTPTAVPRPDPPRAPACGARTLISGPRRRAW